MPKDYAFAFAACGLFSTFLGQSVIDWVVRRYKKDAIVILVIASIMLIALVLMTYDGVMQVVHATTYGFSPRCGQLGALAVAGSSGAGAGTAARAAHES